MSVSVVTGAEGSFPLLCSGCRLEVSQNVSEILKVSIL